MHAMSALVHPAVAALVAALLPAVSLATVAQTLRRRREIDKAEPEQTGPESPEALEYRGRGMRVLYLGVNVALLACILGAFVLRVQLRPPEEKCAAKRSNLRHAGLYASRVYGSSLPASPDDQTQDLFDAALIHAFGFDHVDALDLFERAAEADPECSMCIWGQAYALGPFVNRALYEVEERPNFPVFTCSDADEVRQIAQQAQKFSEKYEHIHIVKPLVDLLVQRYSPDAPCSTDALQRAELQYAHELAQVAIRHRDPTVAALAAEAYMNAYAWNYTVSQTSPVLREDAATALQLIDYALALSPLHVLALHLKIHMLETQPLADEDSNTDSQQGAIDSATESDDGDSNSWPLEGSDQMASLTAAEEAADTLAGLRHTSWLPGHLIHMPAHIYFRMGRWKDAIDASVAAVEMNKLESLFCFSPYAPEHNLDTGLASAVLAGDYKHAKWAADGLQQSHNVFLKTYVSNGINHAATVEVALYFGRCYTLRSTHVEGARGRSSSNGEKYMAALNTLRDVLCIVQPSLSTVSQNLPPLKLHPDEEVARLVNSLAVQASEMPGDAVTVPGFGVGLYSAGYNTQVKILLLFAKAAQACMTQDWRLAAARLESAVDLEFSMGYMEPPRLTMSVRPCLASIFILSGNVSAAEEVLKADQIQFPHNWWGTQARAAVTAVHSRASVHEVQRSAMAACKLFFGEGVWNSDNMP